jgi:hypothetical protein
MAIALGVLSWSFWYFEEKPPPVFAIGGMAVVAGAYSFSYGPLNWLITAELFTVGVRGTVCATPATSLDCCAGSLASAIVDCVASAWRAGVVDTTGRALGVATVFNWLFQMVRNLCYLFGVQ